MKKNVLKVLSIIYLIAALYVWTSYVEWYEAKEDKIQKLPTKVIINQIEYEIRWSSDLLNIEGVDVWGFTTYEDQRIDVSLYSGRERARMALVHEITHAALWEYGADYKNMTEEKICNLEAAIWRQLLRDNKEFIAFLQEEDK